MYIDDPIGKALGLPPSKIPIEIDISEYPPIRSAWFNNLQKFRYKPSEWEGTEAELARRKKISSTMKGRTPVCAGKKGALNNKARKVICHQSGIVYGSLIECSKDTGVTVRTIQNWCKKETKTTNNNHWSGLSFSYMD